MAAGVLDLTIGHKEIGGRCLFENFSLSVGTGEIVCLIGPSGRGKTTALRIAAGLDQDYQGQCQQHAPNGVAVVFQEPRLLPWRSALDNITLCLSHFPTAAARTERAMKSLAQVGLEESAALRPGQMSLGMQRRVALARALATGPSLLIADEPTASLDDKTARQIRTILKATADMGCGVLMATHNPDDWAMATHVRDLGP